MSTVLELIKRYQHTIEKYPEDEQKLLRCIEKLHQLDVTVKHLEETGVGRTVNALRKESGYVGEAARALVKDWKYMVAAEERSEAEDYNNETTNYNGHGSGGDSEDNDRQSKDYRSSDSGSTSKHHSYQMNGDQSTSKRKYHSSEEEEQDTKKSRYSYTAANDKYDRYSNVKVKSENDSQRSNSDDSHDDDESDSESESSQYSESEEDVKPKEEKEASQSSSRNKVTKICSPSPKIKEPEYKKECKSESQNSYDKHTSSTSHSRDKHETENNSHKRHKSSSSDKPHKSSHSKHSGSSEKQITKDKDDTHKHRSSSQSNDRKSDKQSSKSHKSSDRHKQSSENETSSKERDKSKDSHKKSDSEKSKERTSSSKEKSSQSDKKREEKKHSSSSDKKTKSSENKSSSHKEKEIKHSSSSSSHHKSSNSSSKSSKSKSSSSSKLKEDAPKKIKQRINSEDSNDGIDCGSGASFAEALGMLSPVKPKKKTVIKDAQSPHSSTNYDCSPTLPLPLLAPTSKLTPLPPLEISALPEISPNYKPRPPPKLLPHFTEEESLSVAISSKNQRTKVYSGNKTVGKVSSLYELCVQVLQEHIDSLEYTGGVPYDILKPVVDRATPDQMFILEHYNPYLMEDTDHLWQKFCEKRFRNKKREELESWREMYMRCQEEQDYKLKSLTANIKLAQDAKNAPVKQTKMAYVDSVVKPPRNVARKQALHGTARLASASPAARVASLSSAGNVARVGAIRPPTAPTSSFSALQKPKKAPLMQKALQLMRGRKR